MTKRRNPGRRTYTVAEVAELYQVTDETVRHMIKRGDLVALRVGSQWRIAEKALEDYEAKIRSRCSPRPPAHVIGSGDSTADVAPDLAAGS